MGNQIKKIYNEGFGDVFLHKFNPNASYMIDTPISKGENVKYEGFQMNKGQWITLLLLVIINNTFIGNILKGLFIEFCAVNWKISIQSLAFLTKGNAYNFELSGPWQPKEFGT